MTTQDYQDLKRMIANCEASIENGESVDDTLSRVIETLSALLLQIKITDSSLHSHVNSENAHNF